MKGWVYTLIFAVAFFALGWCLRPMPGYEAAITTRTERLDTTFFRLPAPEPIVVTSNIQTPTLLFARDTIIEHGDTVYLTASIDTASVVADYLTRREYRLDFSTDTTGTFIVDAVVEQNRLLSADATIAPLLYTTEILHKTKRKRFAVVAGVSGGIAPNGKMQVVVGLSGGFKIVEF